jgi:uncharacterized protein YbbC (DUF1343 family)
LLFLREAENYRSMEKKRLIVFCLCVCSFLPAASQYTQPLQTGAEQIPAIVALVKNKRVGLAVNRTSVLGRSGQVHLLDTLLACGIAVKKVFAPEHGFRGNAEAGEDVSDSRDTKTGVPVLSIYGKNKKPTAEQLQDLDAVIFDMQDVGVRFYTYISTMHYVMEACADNNKEFIVLDRPNPNDFIDGPMRRKGFESFVGVDPIPVLHGLTIGELARMINGERWLISRPDTCRLTVIPLQNWRHGDPYRLPVRPSPNLPNEQAIRLYPSLCWFEATEASIGRGTDYPFQVIGYPDKSFGDFTFTPLPLPGFDSRPLQMNKECFGIDLRDYRFAGGLTLMFFLDFYEKAGRKEAFFARPEWFDLLAGNGELRRQIVLGLTEDAIRASWQPELNEYKTLRKKYLLYHDYPANP